MKHLIFTLISLCLVLCRVNAQDIQVPETQRALIVKHSATWCPPCGGQAWTTYETLLGQYESEAVFMQAHRSTSSLFYSPNAQDLFNNADASFTQPEFFFNTTRVASTNTTDGQLASRIETATAAKPIAQTGISFTFSPADRTLQVKTKTHFFQPGNGNYYLSVFLLVKDTLGFQEARGQNQVHKRVLRRALTQSTFGELIATNEPQGVDKTFSVSTQLEDRIAIDKVQIVAVLWRKNSDGKYDFVNTNVQSEATQLTTSRESLSVARPGFTVLPTTVTDGFNVQIDLPRAQTRVDLTLFNLLGQPVQELYRGALPAGAQSLRFDRPASAGSGIYLLRFTAGREMITRRVYFQ